MKKLISERFAAVGALTILILFFILRMTLLYRIIFYEQALNDRFDERRFMWGLSIVINLLEIIFVAIKVKLLKLDLPDPIITMGLWFMFGISLLAIMIISLSSITPVKFVNILLNLLFSVFCLRLQLVIRLLLIVAHKREHPNHNCQRPGVDCRDILA